MSVHKYCEEMHLRHPLPQREWFSWPVGVVFVTSILVTFVFWMILPDTFRINESSDYISFYEPVGRNILAGRGFTRADGSPALVYPPGYPLLLAGLFGFSHLLNISEETILSTF